MRNFVLAIAAVAALSPLAFAAHAAEVDKRKDVAAVRKKITGVWKLIGTEVQVQDGKTTYPRGQHPSGYIIYTADGHMFVQIQDGAEIRPPAHDGPMTEAEQAQAYRSYTAYYGPYTLNTDEGYVVHHREGSLVPNQSGGEVRRYYEFKGDELILHIPSNNPGQMPSNIFVRVN